MQIITAIVCLALTVILLSEVFNKIDYQKESDGISGRKINIGDRLLIYIIIMDGKSNIQGVINSKRGGKRHD